MHDVTWFGGDVESQIKELEAELHYYASAAKARREKAQKLISEAVRYEVSAELRRKRIRLLREVTDGE